MPKGPLDFAAVAVWYVTAAVAIGGLALGAALAAGAWWVQRRDR